jgi:hypothetical protein
MKNSVSVFSHARDCTVNGGRFYTIGTNIVQGIGKQKVVLHFEQHKNHDGWAQYPTKL